MAVIAGRNNERKLCCYALRLLRVKEEASSTMAALACFRRGFEHQLNASSRGQVLFRTYK
jgi:hypothetical protein